MEGFIGNDSASGRETTRREDDGRRRPTPEEDIRQLIEELNARHVLTGAIDDCNSILAGGAAAGEEAASGAESLRNSVIEALKNAAGANKRELSEIFSRVPELSQRMGEIAINAVTTGVLGDLARTRAELAMLDGQIAELLEDGSGNAKVRDSKPMISVTNLRFDLIEKYGRPEPKSEDELE